MEIKLANDVVFEQFELGAWDVSKQNKQQLYLPFFFLLFACFLESNRKAGGADKLGFMVKVE